MRSLTNSELEGYFCEVVESSRALFTHIILQYGDGSHDPEPEGPRSKTQDPLHFNSFFVTVIEISYLLILINLGEDLFTLEPILNLLEPILCLIYFGAYALSFGAYLMPYELRGCSPSTSTFYYYVMELRYGLML